MNFQFGVGQSADITLEQAEAVEAGTLIVYYVIDDAPSTYTHQDLASYTHEYLHNNFVYV